MELTGVELNEFLLKKAGKTWDDVIEEGATIKDIDENSIAQFVEDGQEKGEYPIAALREMLLNALVHRAYTWAPLYK